MTTDEVVMPFRDKIDRELEADKKARIERKYKCSDCGKELSPARFLPTVRSDKRHIGGTVAQDAGFTPL